MKKDYGKYIAALLLFGSNGIIAGKIGMTSTGIVFWRTLLGSAFLLAVFLLSRQKFSLARHKKALLFLICSGAAMGASWMFLFEAYDQVGVSVASLAYYCGPVIVAALSPALFGERLTRVKIICFAAVAAGVVLVSARGGEAFSPWGLFCGGMSAVLYAAMVIFNKKAAGITGLENASLQLLFGFLTAAVFIAFAQGGAALPSAADWVWIAVLGLLNTGAGCYLYFSSIGGLPVQTVAVLGYLEPLCAVVLSALLLGETLSPAQIAGAALILGGACAAETAGRNKKTAAGSSGGETEP